jgi:hypothetical protein
VTTKAPPVFSGHPTQEKEADVLDRLTFAALIKSALAAMALPITTVIGVRVWEDRRRPTDSARILRIADISGQTFKILVHARTDRRSTERGWNDPKPITPVAAALIEQLQGTQIPALAEAANLPTDTEFTDPETLLPALRQFVGNLWDSGRCAVGPAMEFDLKAVRQEACISTGQ